VNVYLGRAGEVATGAVGDKTGKVLYAFTGPQVAWLMARGDRYDPFGGTLINNTAFWLCFCAVFLAGLVDWRRPLSLRTVDILTLLSLTVSLWFFRHGNVFAAMPLAYPPLLWLLGRCIWVARGDRRPLGTTRWPVWALVAATVVLVGVRVGQNLHRSQVVDVGYSGVIGAERIAHGVDPYGHFPVAERRPVCGHDQGVVLTFLYTQTNGRCEAANPAGDTYGPVAYLAYVPAWAIFGWDGHWTDGLRAAHAAAIAFDLLAIVGLWFVGRRFGGPRLGAAAAFAWAAWPFTQYVSSANTNDALLPAILVWGFLVLTSDAARGAVVALSAWTKFAPLLLLPLWSGYPEARRGTSTLRFAVGFLLVTCAVFLVLLFDPSLSHAVRVFYDNTFGRQLDRVSPFSIWDWRQYHASGLPDLHLQQKVLQVLLVLGAVALAFVPRRRSPLRMAALTAAVLIGFEIVLTHWSYLYLSWFFPFVALALLAPLPGRDDEPSVAA
jgi:hypothetical protein